MHEKKWGQALLTLGIAVLLSACSTLDTGQAPSLSKSATWVVLPMINNTETPQVGARLAAVTASLLRSRNVTNLTVYPVKDHTDFLNQNDQQTQQAALAWAQQQQARYAVTGSVQEWRYKTGLDGEPAAGITLNIIDLSNNRVIWSGSGARTGWSRESVSGVAQELIKKLVNKSLTHATE